MTRRQHVYFARGKWCVAFDEKRVYRVEYDTFRQLYYACQRTHSMRLMNPYRITRPYSVVNTQGI